MQRGERTLASIANSYGVSVARVRASNPKLKSGTTHLRPGQKITIPLVTFEEKVISELERANEATGEELEIVYETNKILARRVRELKQQLLRSFVVGVVFAFEKRVVERELVSARAAIKILRGMAPLADSRPLDTEGE